MPHTRRKDFLTTVLRLILGAEALIFCSIVWSVMGPLRRMAAFLSEEYETAPQIFQSASALLGTRTGLSILLLMLGGRWGGIRLSEGLVDGGTSGQP